RALSAAKFSIGRIGALVAEEAIQMHGGIGMTWELPLAHYAKRLVMIDHQLGDEDHHLQRYIALGRSQREGAVLVLTHNNPSVRNALSPEFYAALNAALQQAAADDSVGAVVLTGAEGMFCSGGDLRQLIKRRELPETERRERLEGLHDLIRSLRDCPKPVVAAVEGAAAGAGLSIALACDML
ncbi:hypothetical protein KXX11_003806, partial [Aspergillus fumigatus]